MKIIIFLMTVILFKVSHSLPLQHGNYSAPLSVSLHNNSSDYDVSSYKDKNNLVKQQNERARQECEYAITRAPKVAEYTTIQQINNDFRYLSQLFILVSILSKLRCMFLEPMMVILLIVQLVSVCMGLVVRMSSLMAVEMFHRDLEEQINI